MKNSLLIPICCVLLLCVSSCVTSNFKCPQFSAKRSSPGVHYTASAKYTKSKPKSQAAPAQARKQEDASLDGIAFAGLSGGDHSLELRIPKMFMNKMGESDLEEADRIFKSESDNRVMLVKRGHKLFLKAKSASDILSLTKTLSKKPASAPGGGAGGGIALAAGILGIVSFVLAFGPYADFLAILLAIIAIILGFVGLSSGRLFWALMGIIFGFLALAVAGVFIGIVYIHIF